MSIVESTSIKSEVKYVPPKEMKFPENIIEASLHVQGINERKNNILQDNKMTFIEQERVRQESACQLSPISADSRGSNDQNWATHNNYVNTENNYVWTAEDHTKNIKRQLQQQKDHMKIQRKSVIDRHPIENESLASQVIQKPTQGQFYIYTFIIIDFDVYQLNSCIGETLNYN